MGRAACRLRGPAERPGRARLRRQGDPGLSRWEWLTAVGLGIVVSSIFWIDPAFVPLALAGPIVWGGLAGRRHMSWRWPVTVSVVAGFGAVLSDLVLNREDVTFHFALTFTMTAFAWSAWSIALRFAREDHRG